MSIYYITGLSCNNCVKKITDALLNEFVKVHIDLKTGMLEIEGNGAEDFERIRYLIKRVGRKYDASTQPLTLNTQEVKIERKGSWYVCFMGCFEGQENAGTCPVCGMALEPEDPTLEMDNSELNEMNFKFWISLIFSVPLLVINMGMHFFGIPVIENHTAFNWFQFFLATPVVLWCGFVFFKRGLDFFKNRRLNMFSLISVGVLIAYFYSILITLFPNIFNVQMDVYFEPASVIISFVLLGQVLELKARAKTTSAIKSLLDLSPQTANLILDRKEQKIAVSMLKKDDLVVVKSGEKIPADGIVTKGESSVNESMLTGESMPQVKVIGSPVIGGTLNGEGLIFVKITNVGKDTKLQQIVKMVSVASRSRIPIQNLVDKISAIFVPIVIFIAIFTYIIWSFYSTEFGFISAISVLIIACPCALGLATPMSIMVGSGLGAKMGVLFKSAETFENISKIDILVLDKTGTLTIGKPKLKMIKSLANLSEKEILTFASALENGSSHPIAHAILEKVKGDFIPEIHNFKSITGKGISGEVLNKFTAIGNLEFMKFLNINISTQTFNEYEKLIQNGDTVLLLALENEIIAMLAISDEIKKTTKEFISKIKKQGIKPIMLTGDGKKVAENVAKEVGIEEFKAEVLPEHKYLFIKELQEKGFKVAMVGDGINDAPALMQANVGIAMGTGSEIAIESAGITLVSGDLKGIINAIMLSKNVLSNIKQNLALAFGYNALAIPIASGLFYYSSGLLLNPMIASASMALSSVSVILNSIRLNSKKFN